MLSDYEKKVLKWIEESPFNQQKNIDTSSLAFLQFWPAVKRIIDLRLDLKGGYEIEFNANYSKLRKRKMDQYNRINKT